MQTVHVGVEGLEGADAGVLRLPGGRRRAVLEVSGVSLSRLDGREQEASVAALAGFLNALTGPVQFLLRATPVDPDGAVCGLERRLRREPEPALAALGHQHAAFVRGLAAEGRLLERRCYVVVPGPAPAAPGPAGWLRRVPWPGGAGRGGPDGASGEGDEAVAADPADPAEGAESGALLAMEWRCDEVARQLAGCGLASRRLRGSDLAGLLGAWWRPERAGGLGPPAGPDSWEGDDEPARAAPSPHPAGGCRPRPVADLVAPAAVEIGRDRVRLERTYARVLALTAYPRVVSPGWLAPLLDTDLPLELSLHVAPLPTPAVSRDLGQRLARLESARLLAERRGRLADPETEVAAGDVARLRDALQRGEERVFEAALYLLLRAPDAARLDARTERAEAVLDGLLAQSRVAVLEQARGLRACAPVGDDPLRRCRRLDTTSLAATLPVGAAVAGGGRSERSVFLGVARPGSGQVRLDPFGPDLDNANVVVMATPGAGKSYFAKLLALRSLLAGVDVLAVDPEGEYRALCAAAGGQHVRLAAASPRRINPFDLPPPDERGPAAEDEDEDGGDPLAEQVAALVGLLEVLVATPAAPLTPDERAPLDRALYRTYAAAGITADPSTHARPAPLLADLHAVLEDGGGAAAAGLAARLHRYVHGSLGRLFAGPTDVTLDRRLVVFDVQGLDPALRPAAIHLVTGLVWRRLRRDPRPRLLVVDEAWSLLQYPEGGAMLAGLARRARKRYLGLVTVSQDVPEFLRAPHGQIVLRTAATKLLLKQDPTAIDEVAAALRLSAEDRRLLLAAPKGEGLLCTGASRRPVRVLASAAEHALVTTAPAEVAARAGRPGARRAGTPDDDHDRDHETRPGFVYLVPPYGPAPIGPGGDGVARGAGAPGGGER